MKKNNIKDNTLIKRKNLILELKKKGIKRINPNSLILLEDYFKKYLDKITEVLKEEMLINGRKTLKEEGVKITMNKLKKEDNFWEI